MGRWMDGMDPWIVEWADDGCACTMDGWKDYWQMDVKEALPLVSSVASISIYHSSLDKHSIYQSLADQKVFECRYQSESAMKDSCHSTASPAMPTAHLQGYHSLRPLGWHGNVYPIRLSVKGILVRQSNDEAQWHLLDQWQRARLLFIQSECWDKACTLRSKCGQRHGCTPVSIVTFTGIYNTYLNIPWLFYPPVQTDKNHTRLHDAFVDFLRVHRENLRRFLGIEDDLCDSKERTN